MARTGSHADLDAPGGAERERIGERVVMFRRGRRWWAEYVLDKHQRREALGTTNKKEARRRAIQIEARLAEGTHRPAARAPLISEVSKLYQGYLKSEGRRESTLKRYGPELGRIVTFAATQGATRLSDVNIKLLDAYREDRTADGAGPATVYHESTLFKQLMNFAVRRDMLPSNPLKNAKLRKPKATDQPVYTLAEVDAIICVATPFWKGVFEFLSCTGLRIGELCALTWDDIDEANGFVLVRSKNGWQPKDGDDRKVPINERLRELLAHIPRSSSLVFSGRPCAKYPKGGQHISARRALSALKTAVRRAGMKAGTLHTFRHFFISHCILSGVPPLVVADWVGHSSLDMVMRYFKLLPNQSREAMVKVSFSAANGREGV
jgi:integrase